MNQEQLERAKSEANELLGIFERYMKGECTRDRALEDIAYKTHDILQRRSIVGYVKSNMLGDLLRKIYNDKKQNPEKTYMYDCKIHQNDIMDMERILKSI